MDQVIGQKIVHGRYVAQLEHMEGEWYWMIYRKGWLFGKTFVERWKTFESCVTRIKELAA